MRRQLSLLLLFFFASTPFVLAQAPAAVKPAVKPAAKPTDVLIFANGDRLTGKLVSVTDGNVVFNSDMAGTLTISIDKIKQLKSGAQFALLRKGEAMMPLLDTEGVTDLAPLMHPFSK